MPDSIRRPGTYREFVFAAGPGSSGQVLTALLYGNKTSAGTDTLDVIGTPILDRVDARKRFGARSELYWQWKLFNAVDKTTLARAIPVTQGTGALTRTLTFAAGVATVTTVGIISFQGETAEFTVPLGATAIEQAAAFASAFNNASNGEWMATAAVGGGGSEHIVTITASQQGTRLAPLLDISLRFAYREDPTTTATFGAATTPGTDDDFTTAYAQAATGFHYYQINPKTGVTAPTTTDNGIGEGIAYLRDQNLPANGKAQRMFFGLTGTQAQATTVVTDADANEVVCHAFRAEDSDWTAGMIAAHYAGVVTSEEAGHPAANIIGYRNGFKGRGILLGPPDPFDKTDRPTPAEIELDLQNGISPIAFDDNGNPYLVRLVTMYTEVSAGVKDYRASEGHVASVMHRMWDEVFAKWEAEKQDNIGDDPPAGTPPRPRTSTAGQVKALLNWAIDQGSGPRPFGKWSGALLSQFDAEILYMRNAITAERMSGGFQVGADWLAVEHLVKTYVTLRQTNPAQ
jgi:phage tail sheath gpL-like